MTVIDKGIGISEKEVPYIFDKFWRGDRARAKVQDGTGVGLTVIKDLVGRQRGTIKVIKSEVGEGTEFAFSLPMYG